jgi:hypothetical protein
VKADWDVPHRLVGPAGTLPLNEEIGTEGMLFLLAPRRCSALLPVRDSQAEDFVPQGHGRIPHARWRGGYIFTLDIELWEDRETIACHEKLREMLDLLGLHVNALLNPAGGARIYWTPTDYGDDRLLDQIQLLEAGPPGISDETGATTVPLVLDSPFPYYLDGTEQQTPITDGNTVAIMNGGNAEQKPVVKMDGPTAYMELVNLDALDEQGNPLMLVYDSANTPGGVAIGSGAYVEFDFFRETAYLNGNGPSRMAGIDMLLSDFFPLVPGENRLQVSGTDVTVLSNHTWA